MGFTAHLNVIQVSEIEKLDISSSKGKNIAFKYDLQTY